MRTFIYKAVENCLHNDIAISSSELTLKHKNTNDVHTYSHHAVIKVGDNKSEMYCIDINKVLTQASSRIKQSVRKDEFSVLLEDIYSPQEAELISKKIISILREPFYIDGYKAGVTASISIAMYRAKDKQKDTYEFFDTKLKK